MQPINEAVSIMVVGIITVFFILFVIVFIGNLLIRLLNKYLPEVVVEPKLTPTNNNSEKTHAAIAAAIDLVTKGKGKITNITKI